MIERLPGGRPVGAANPGLAPRVTLFRRFAARPLFAASGRDRHHKKSDQLLSERDSAYLISLTKFPSCYREEIDFVNAFSAIQLHTSERASISCRYRSGGRKPRTGRENPLRPVER
jgi:hypothetical protein